MDVMTPLLGRRSTADNDNDDEEEDEEAEEDDVEDDGEETDAVGRLIEGGRP